MTDPAADIVASMRHPILVLDRDLRVKLANPAFYKFFEVSCQETEGCLLYELGDGQWDIPELRRLLTTLMEDRPEIADYRVEYDFEKIGRRIMLFNARHLERSDGAVILLAFEDVTENERSAEALHEREEWMKNVLETAAVGVLFFDERSGILINANDAFLEMSGYDRKEVGTVTWRDMTPPEWVDISERQLEKLSATGLIGPYEKEYLNKDGSRSWMVFTGRSLGNGTIVEYCFDISDHIRERKEIEKHRELLLAELSHRVKNTLAVVQGLASQTLARSKSLKEFKAAFEGRLAALARSHNQLFKDEWKPADLGDLVEEATSGFDPGRVKAGGPAVHIDPRVALSLNLVLHELETNSAKYGALSGKDGHVEISWTREDDGMVHIVWEEQDGPPVAFPEREGFGTRLIKQLVEYDLNGEVRLHFNPGGLRTEFAFQIFDG